MKTLDQILEEAVRSKLTKEVIDNKIKEIVDRVVAESLNKSSILESKPAQVAVSQPSTNIIPNVIKQPVQAKVFKTNIKQTNTSTIDINNVRVLAKRLNTNLRKRLSDQRYRHKVGEYNLTPGDSLSTIVDLLLTESGYKLLQRWSKDSFRNESRNRIIVEFIDPKKGVDKENLRLIVRAKARTFHHPTFNKVARDTQSWVKQQVESSTVAPIYYNPNRNEWVVTIRNGSRFVVKKHFKTKEEAHNYALNFKTEEPIKAVV